MWKEEWESNRPAFNCRHPLQDRQDCMRQKVRRVVIWALEHSQALSPLEVAHPLHPVWHKFFGFLFRCRNKNNNYNNNNNIIHTMWRYKWTNWQITQQQRLYESLSIRICSKNSSPCPFCIRIPKEMPAIVMKECKLNLSVFNISSCTHWLNVSLSLSLSLVNNCVSILFFLPRIVTIDLFIYYWSFPFPSEVITYDFEI